MNSTKPAIEPPTLTIVVPYADAGRLTTYWAITEEQVDWERPGRETERCTSAFAATELQAYLARTVPSLRIGFGESAPAEGAAIVIGPSDTIREVLGLAVETPLRDPQSYLIRSHPWRGRSVLVLAGGGREGVLYAAYSYLAALGWRWYEPGKSGEVAPPERASLSLEGWNLTATPDFPLFRGFHMQFEGEESIDLFVWMARNRLNAWSYHPRSYSLMKKLGFRLISGGHILERILHPDTPQPGGKTLFEEHQDWFPEIDGKRERKNADRYNFCVTNAAATHYVARHIVDRFRTDWRWTDYQHVWMLDTWAGWCQCDRCRALGNDADRYLHFLSQVRMVVDAAVKGGELKHNTGMALCAYEGTPSLEGPSRAVPKNLTGGEDFALFAPINRCYVHALEDPGCTEMNEHYVQAIDSWGQTSNSLPLAVVEYYNVSKFEDLPLLFSHTMGADFAYYKRVGVRGMSYMHAPIALWGPRALNHALYSRLAWDSQASVERITEEYIRLCYGPAAEPMRDFYEHLETAYANITAWRSWFHPSINRQLLDWKGETPAKPLFTLRHLQPEHGDGIGPDESLRHLDQAKESLGKAFQVKVPLAARLRIEEDARAFRYGDDSFRFYWAIARLYESERSADEAALRQAWTDVEHYAASLNSYYVPFDYEYPGPGVRAKDGLARTQLRPLLDLLRTKYEGTL